jgi:hypothetical protein
MKVPAACFLGWSRRHFLWVAGGGVLLHVLLAGWFGEKAKPTAVVAAPDPLLSWLVEPSAASAALRSSLAARPTLFVLPSLDNFSGGAWMRSPISGLEYAPWTEDPRWLNLNTNDLGGDLLQSLAASRPVGTPPTLLPRVSVSAAEILLVNDPVATQSVVRVEGGLVSRRYQLPSRLPMPAHADVLSNTVLRVTASSPGFVDSAIVISSCGSHDIDQQAMRWAQGVRLAPAEAKGETADLVSGRMVFQWLTAALPQTNSIMLR